MNLVFHTKVSIFFLTIRYAETVYIKKQGLVRVAVTFLWRVVTKKESWARKLIFPPTLHHTHLSFIELQKKEINILYIHTFEACSSKFRIRVRVSI